MAQYEESASTVVDNITNSGLSDSTKDAINKVINDTAGQTGGNVKIEEYSGGKASADTVVINVGKNAVVTEDPGAPVIIMSAEATQGANVTLNADAPRTVVASNQADNIVFEGNAAVTVETGGGNDNISTGNGDNLVNVTGSGDSTVTTGTGNDTVVITGEGKVHVTTTGGDNEIVLGTDKAEVTVTGGTGFDKVKLDDNRGNHDFAVVDGKVVMHSENPTTMENVQVVEFTGDGTLSVFASDHDESVIAKMYQVVFDRDADVDGIKFWEGFLDQGNSLEHTVYSFINSAEFGQKFESLSNEDFLASMYTNLAGREADVEGMAYWMGRLNEGYTRADVAWSFAESAEASQVMGIDGEQYVIDLF